MKRYLVLLTAAVGLVFANPVIVTFINEVGIDNEGNGRVELHQESMGENMDLTGWRLQTNSIVCTLSCQLGVNDFLIIDSAALAQGVIGRGSFRLNPVADRVMLLPVEPPLPESVCYPVIPTGIGCAPTPPMGGSVALFSNGSSVINWYIDSTPTPGDTNDD